MNGHNVPVLGGAPVRMGAGVQALVRKLDEDGTYAAQGLITTPNGPMPVSKREDYMDAVELLDAIRQIVREEIAASREVTMWAS